MKICHCVKVTSEEKKALQVVSNMMREASEDAMLDSAFESEYGNIIKDATWGVDAFKEFIEQFIQE